MLLHRTHRCGHVGLEYALSNEHESLVFVAPIFSTFPYTGFGIYKCNLTQGICLIALLPLRHATHRV
jgi:hypothetical protein